MDCRRGRKRRISRGRSWIIRCLRRCVGFAFFRVQGLLMLDGPGRCQANSWDNFTSSCMLPRICGNLYQKTLSRNVGPRNDMVYQVIFLGFFLSTLHCCAAHLLLPTAEKRLPCHPFRSHFSTISPFASSRVYSSLVINRMEGQHGLIALPLPIFATWQYVMPTFLLIIV